MLPYACKKDPQIGYITTKVVQIVAGDSSGRYIHHVINGTQNFGGYFDIDKDSKNDFSFYDIFRRQNPEVYNDDFVVGTSAYAYIAGDVSGATVLKTGDIINNNLKWASGSRIGMISKYHNGLPNGYDQITGKWANNTDGYLAFKIVKKDQTYWGWIHILNGFYIKDYAYTRY